MSLRTPSTERPLSCRKVGKVLQALLDGESDDVTAERVEAHLEACRRCGLEATMYREIKASLGRGTPDVPELTLRRLRDFGSKLAVAGTDSRDGPG